MAMRNSKSRDLETKKGLWSKEEDDKLVTYINRYGIWNWAYMPEAAGLARSGKSCRLRWMNYLRPNLRHGNFAPEEEEEIIRLHRLLGNQWAAIAANFPGRTDNDIKNHWNTRLKTRAYADGPSLTPNSGNNSAITAETPAYEIDSLVGSYCSSDNNRLVIPDSSPDIDSLWSELPPLGNQDDLLEAPNMYDYEYPFSFFGQHGDHVGANSSSYYDHYEEDFSDNLWGSQ